MRDERILRTGTKIVGGGKKWWCSVEGGGTNAALLAKNATVPCPNATFFQPQMPQRSVTVLLCQPKCHRFLSQCYFFSATNATTFCYSATLSAKNATVPFPNATFFSATNATTFCYSATLSAKKATFPCPNATFFSHKSHNVLL
jgi:hypothetical protein